MEVGKTNLARAVQYEALYEGQRDYFQSCFSVSDTSQHLRQLLRKPTAESDESPGQCRV